MRLQRNQKKSVKKKGVNRLWFDSFFYRVPTDSQLQESLSLPHRSC
ncbi:CRISPR-associated protein Cas5 [Bacillus sp. PS06]